jgi:hypothetical protein
VSRADAQPLPTTPWLGDETHRVLIRACRLARRLQAPSIGGEWLLRAALYEFGTLGGEPRRARALALSRPASVTSGVVPDTADEADTSLDVAGALREAHWRVFGVPRPGQAPRNLPWASDVFVILGEALHGAAYADTPIIGPRQVLDATLMAPSDGSRDLLEALGLQPFQLRAAAARATRIRSPICSRGGSPRAGRCHRAARGSSSHSAHAGCDAPYR